MLPKVRNKKGKLNTYSGTFGTDDVFTLAWLAEVAAASWQQTDPLQADKWNSIAKDVLDKARKKLDDWEEGKKWESLFDPASAHKLPKDKKKAGRSMPHAFQVLRAVQTVRRLRGAKVGALTEQFNYFERLLHEQLSFSAIPDSRFDPAELMFPPGEIMRLIATAG